jgi:hypothetical protein
MNSQEEAMTLVAQTAVLALEISLRHSLAVADREDHALAPKEDKTPFFVSS